MGNVPSLQPTGTGMWCFSVLVPKNKTGCWQTSSAGMSERKRRTSSREPSVVLRFHIFSDGWFDGECLCHSSCVCVWSLCRLWGVCSDWLCEYSSFLCDAYFINSEWQEFSQESCWGCHLTAGVSSVKLETICGPNCSTARLVAWSDNSFFFFFFSAVVSVFVVRFTRNPSSEHAEFSVSVQYPLKLIL